MTMPDASSAQDTQLDSMADHAGKAIAVRERAKSPGLDFGTAWDYAPAPETVKVAVADRYGLFINGAFVEPKGAKPAARGKSASHFATLNPANEQVLSHIASASAADVDAAVQAARKAQPKWAALAPSERAKFLFRIARRVQERARELAILETR